MTDQQTKDYQEAISEAKRFIKRAEEAIIDINIPHTYHSKANATAKRASMDLTNALVKLRH